MHRYDGRANTIRPYENGLLSMRPKPENFDSKLLQEIFPKNKLLPQSSIKITYLQPLFESGFSGFIGLAITSPV